MINTLDKTEREKVNMAAVAAPVPAKDLEKATGDEKNKFYDVNDLDNGIELNVEYGNLAAGIRSKYYDGQTGEVVASAKYMVPLGTPWAKERVNIAEAYPKFNAWIADESVKFWDYPSNDPSKFYNDNTNTIVGLDPVKYAEGNIISNNGEEEVTDLGEEEMTSSSYTESFEPATNTLMATPTGTPIYDYSTNGYGYLYDGGYVIATSSTSITAGSKIRVYGVSIDDWEVTCVNKRKTQSNTSDYTSNGYVEFDVTGNWGRSLVIQGKNFTITYVTVVEPTSGSITLWQGGPTNGYQEFEISAGDTKIKDIKDGDVIRIHATQNDDFYVDIHALTGWTTIGSQLNKNNVTWVNGNNDSYFDYTLGSGEGTLIKNNGIKIQMNQMSGVTKVELIHK
jgi:hypothetical protein